MEVGKETVTVSLAVPPNPFSLAYLHGVLGSVVLQVNGDEVANDVVPDPFVPAKMLIMAACAAESAAVWAIWRCE